jgi:hypothetical protein
MMKIGKIYLDVYCLSLSLSKYTVSNLWKNNVSPLFDATFGGGVITKTLWNFWGWSYYKKTLLRLFKCSVLSRRKEV